MAEEGVTYDDDRADLRDDLGEALEILDQVAEGQDVSARAAAFVQQHRDRLDRWRRS